MDIELKKEIEKFYDDFMLPMKKYGVNIERLCKLLNEESARTELQRACELISKIHLSTKDLPPT
jgi:hypothetical protein